MTIALAWFAAAAVQITVGTVALKPADFLDGRAIAGSTGAPVVMLTLAPKSAAAVRKLGPTASVKLAGRAVVARIADNIIELDGQPDFDAAAKLALAITGKPPLPDSLDE